MKKRILLLALCTIILIAVLTGCSAKATFNVGSDAVDFDNITVKESYYEYTPTSDNKLVLAYFSTSASADINTLTDNFFGKENIAQLEVNGSNYECKGVSFENSTSGMNVVLIFEVPSSASGNATLTANALGSISQNI